MSTKASLLAKVTEMRDLANASEGSQLVKVYHLGMLAFQILLTQLNEGAVTVADIERLRAVKYVGAWVIDKMTQIFF